ncbi:hypothetical protein D3C86_2181040 [compost metagenome]
MPAEQNKLAKKLTDRPNCFSRIPRQQRLRRSFVTVDRNPPGTNRNRAHANVAGDSSKATAAAAIDHN